MFFSVRGFIYKVFAILGAGRQREEKSRYINTVYRFLPTLQNANMSKKIKENNRVGFNSGALLEALAWRLGGGGQHDVRSRPIQARRIGGPRRVYGEG